MQNSANRKPLNGELLTELTWFIFTSLLGKCFEVREKSRRFKCEGDFGKLRPKVCSLMQS